MPVLRSKTRRIKNLIFVVTEEEVTGDVGKN